MRKILLIILIVVGVSCFINCYCQDLVWFNVLMENISEHTVDWITTSLTISSILFMIQGFIVPYTKENVYDKESYIDYLKGIYDKKWEQEQYRPLNNLSDCLLCAILMSLLSAIFILLGYMSNYFIIIAILFASISVIGIFVSLYSMKQTFNHMFGKYK